MRLARHENWLTEPEWLDALLILHDILREERIDLPRATLVIQRDGQYTRTILDSLVQRELLSKTRRTPPSWRLSPQALEICNHPLPGETSSSEPATPPRQTNGDDSEFTSVLLAHVATRGRITRREVIDLCQLSPKAATRMLKDLTQSGALVSHGQTRRKVWYSLPETNPEPHNRSSGHNTDDDLQNTSLILAQVVTRGRITRREVIDLCELSPKAATRVLKHLTQSGALISHGQTRRDAWYSLPEANPETHNRSSGHSADDDLQNISLILAHVVARDRITRREAIDLCQLSPKAATRILKRLTQSGTLVSHGRTRRDTWYGFPKAEPKANRQ